MQGTVKNLGVRVAFIVVLALAAFVYVFPWSTYNITLPFPTHEYKLGLDLHGGVELDYKIDLEEAKKKGGTFSEKDTVEGLKSIVEKRVNSLGTAEPTISTASYGNESHIIVQIPTQNFAGENLTDAEKKTLNAEYIAKAKDTIGKVVRLEFKEQKTEITDADRAERKTLADTAKTEMGDGSLFEIVAKKYRDNYENIEYTTSSGSLKELPKEVTFSGIDTLRSAKFVGPFASEKAGSLSLGQDGNIKTEAGEKGFSIVRVTKVEVVKKEVETTTGTGANAKKEKTMVDTPVYTYDSLFVSEQPSLWTAAKTADGKVLDERYLTKASVSFNQGFQPQIDLLFNTDGAKIFAELTKRMIGKPLAIFVGGQLLTSPTVQTTIPDGHAVITGQYTAESAKKLATDINTGIVPAPIYLTSERAIDAKIGGDSLGVIINAGLIGLLAIIVFLVCIYRVSGLLAGVALIIYGLLLLAIVKAFGIVLTLASIAGIILSIGLAIDANILIFERTKEALRHEKKDLTTSTIVGFEKSWSAIWDSHITSLTSAVILYIFGISLIKGFGLMLGIGIVLSLFTAMWISRILILSVGHKFYGKENAFIGVKK